MPYTLYKTNGLKLTVVDDGKLNLTTDLQFVGANYAGYGQVINENFVKLLENFANGTAPAKPLTGQIWYDTQNKRLKTYNGVKWKEYYSTTVSPNRPADLITGEFWFDSDAAKLYIKNQNSFVLIGPGGASGGNTGGGNTGGSIGTSIVLADTQVEYDVIKFRIGESSPAVISPFAFTVDATDTFVSEYTRIYNGVTLKGADPITGISSNNSTYFWGTAADALLLDGTSPDDFLKKAEVNLLTTNITELGNITRISSGGVGVPGSIEGQWSLEPGSSLQATWSDLAERYHADAIYEPGTVLMLGGVNEVTLSTSHATPSVAGIVSTAPAYMLNSAAGNNDTHPYIALKGRVPCKVVGPISKGDLLVSSGYMHGYATKKSDSDSPNAVIGKALEDFNGTSGVIEVKV